MPSKGSSLSKLLCSCYADKVTFYASFESEVIVRALDSMNGPGY